MVSALRGLRCYAAKNLKLQAENTKYVLFAVRHNHEQHVLQLLYAL